MMLVSCTPSSFAVSTTAGIWCSLTPGIMTIFTFTTAPAFRHHLNAHQLVRQQDSRGVDAGVGFTHILDMIVDLRADFGIDGVERNGDVGHTQPGQRVGIARQHQPVGGQAEGNVRILGADQLQGFTGFFEIGQRVARARNTNDGEVGHGSVSSRYNRCAAACGERTSLVTPGRDSFTQSYLRTQ